MFATIQTTSGKSNIGGFGTASLDKKRRTRCEARGRGGEEEEEEEKQRREIKVCTKKECRRLGSQKTIEFLEERAGKFDLRVTPVAVYPNADGAQRGTPVRNSFERSKKARRGA